LQAQVFNERVKIAIAEKQGVFVHEAARCDDGVDSLAP
jgi:Tat protein secretion system quality control protein TatD with DNase activity